MSYADFLNSVTDDIETLHSTWSMNEDSKDNPYPFNYQSLNSKSLGLAKELERFLGKNLVDIGCNAGLYSYLMGYVANKVTACDVDGQLISRAEAARSYFDRFYNTSNVQYYKANFADMLSGDVNAILACCVLYHIGDDNLKKLQGFLKENACLIIIQVRPQRGEAFKKNPGWGTVSNTKLYNGVYTLEDNINFLRDCGYDQIEVVGMQSTKFFSEYFPIIIAEK